MAGSHVLVGWDPEDTVAWEAGNKVIAGRNLVWSIINEHLGFSVWSIWSVMVLFMPEDIYGLTAGDKFLLTATATFVGACLRIPYTVGVGVVGGRDWTLVSTLVLLIPTAGTIVLLVHPGLSLWPYLVVAMLAGLGGGNFSSSMTNINAFFPQRLKGWALGLNAGGGNIGVPAIQVVGLLVIAAAGHRQPYWVCAIYLVLLVVGALGAALFMDNIEHYRVDVSTMRSVLAKSDTWVISLLSVGTFGSFIGFSFVFTQLLQIKFTTGGQSHAQASLHAAEIAFVGPALGSLARMYGGRLADRVGGGQVTLAVFGGMILATGLLITASTLDEHGGGTTAVTMAGYVGSFLVLFVLSGIGNGSIYKMIPSIFEARSRTRNLGEAERKQWSQSMSGALVGFVGSVGAFGGVGITLVLRQSYISSGAETRAFWVFLGFYIVASVLTWARYLHRPSALR